MERVALAIVGAGVAGCAAAIAAAREGAPALLIGQPPTDGDRPGESLSPAAVRVLAQLGIGDLVASPSHRPNRVTHAAWGAPALSQRHALMHPEGNGFVLDRAAFDRDLADRVRATQTVRIERDLASAARAEDGSWRLEIADGTDISADFVLDCTGRAAVVARQVAHRFRADRLVAAYTFLTRGDPMVEPTRATLIESAETGWWYAALLPDERMALSFFSDPDLLPRGMPRDADLWRAAIAETRFVSRWLESATFESSAPPSLASAATCWLAPAAGNGWAAAGDAACAFDPLSSHGLATALWTGRRAALAALRSREDSPRHLELYATELATVVADFLDQRQRVYSTERRWSESAFWRRRTSLTSP